MPQTPDPSPAEIRRRAAAIRAEWSEQRWERERWRQGVRAIEVRTPPGEYFRNIVRGE